MGRLTHLRALILTFGALSLFILRHNLLTLFYIVQTYLTWYQYSSAVIDQKDDFDSGMSSYPLNQTSAGRNYTDLVPAILHHIVIGGIDLSTRPTWLSARQSCLQWHPNYEHRYWNDSSAEKLIREEYPWFLDVWKGYPYPIQRADSLRYLVLYRFGGIFLDMDLRCRRALGPLRRFEFVSPAANPVGISNGFMMVSARNPFFKVLVDQLPSFNGNFILPYATVMFTTGCMYLSAQYALYNDRCRLRILNYAEHRLSGHRTTPLFQHYGSSSWHSRDASFVRIVHGLMTQLFQYPVLLSAVLCLAIVVSLMLVNRQVRQRREKNAASLLFL